MDSHNKISFSFVLDELKKRYNEDEYKSRYDTFFKMGVHYVFFDTIRRRAIRQYRIRCNIEPIDSVGLTPIYRKKLNLKGQQDYNIFKSRTPSRFTLKYNLKDII